MSFDDGRQWQPLQANLPITPIYDLLVKDTDLVVATHGRSFWILDDLTQLHQIHDELLSAPAHLFKPRDAIRTPPDIFADFLKGSPGVKNYHVTLGQFATFYLDEQETGHSVRRVIDGGDDLPRGVRVTYYLGPDTDAAEATLTFYAADGTKIESFSCHRPEGEAKADGLTITNMAGMNSFQWHMRYPAGPKMLESDFHGRAIGPLAKPGTYRVELEVGDIIQSQSFDLLVDPRVTTTEGEFAEQFGFLHAIQSKLVEVVEAINRTRTLKYQLAALQERLGSTGDIDGQIMAALTSFVEDLVAVEDALVQSELTSDGDTLNYREKLFERLSGLPPVVGSADAPPTTQSRQVFQKLASQIDDELSSLDALVEETLPLLNRQLAEGGIAVLGI